MYNKMLDRWNNLNKKGKTLVVAVAVIIVIAIVQSV
jgi:flagellar biosynthesis/type III secretory pathway M-ring protein FliF/YscJ|tara:strand:+ start:11286 stop:11393 length:108 start_codon:yes stop_codon:yes gene_type:complete